MGMIESDLPEFSKIMAALSENFRDELSENGLALRFDALKDYSIAQIKKAALMLIRDRKYTKMPTVGEIVESIDGGANDRAETQSLIVATALATRTYRDGFEDKITDTIIRYRFGYWWIGHEMLSAQRESFFREFKKLYRAMAREVERKELGMDYNRKLLEWMEPPKPKDPPRRLSFEQAAEASL